MTLALCLAMALSSLATPKTAQPQAESSPVAALTQMTGEVIVRHNQTWVRVELVPVDLFSGDTISTDRGRAEIHFLGDDSTLVLDVGTHLVITQTQTGSSASVYRRIEILLGNVWFSMQHSLSRKTELVTPTAVGGLRGTEGVVLVDSQARSSYTLAQGQLAISSHQKAAGAEAVAVPLLLNPGEIVETERGKKWTARKYTAPPHRPDVKESAERLPQPRQNWRNMLPKEQRPPVVDERPGASNQLHQSKAPKPERPTKPPKPAPRPSKLSAQAPRTNKQH
jgi:hypothetical protein